VLSRIQAVIFDLDGTLVDHRGSVTTALEQWLPLIGSPSSDDLVGAWLAAESRHYPAWRAGEISFAEQRRRRLRDFLPLIEHHLGGDAQLDEVFAGYLACYQAAWTRFDDVDEALRRLYDAGMRIAVLTNGTVEQQNAKLHAVGLASRFEFVVTAEELGVAKPDTSTYLAVCQRLELPVSAVLHVGDLYDLDVIGARVAGLHAVHLDRNDDGPGDESERIRSLAELPEYIVGLA
jgi:putative hydrolase of the HAD superfamily